MKFRNCTLALVGVALSMAAQAQTTDSQHDSNGKKAERIASQPVRDVGLAKTKIPPVLIAASQAPYAPVKGCPQIAGAIRDLNKVLGPDFGTGTKTNENRASVAETGGAAIVNSLIPFRGVVREVSGAASADRRLRAAVDAGFARRGFLHGLQGSRGCKG